MKLIFLTIILFLLSCDDSIKDSAPEKFYSKSKSQYVEITFNKDKNDPQYLCLIVNVFVKNNKIAEVQTSASVNMNWGIKWVSEKEILVKSSDIGDYSVIHSDNKWIYKGPIKSKLKKVSRPQSLKDPN